MADVTNAKENKKFTPFVSVVTDMREFTVRALAIGLVMCVVLGRQMPILVLRQE